jgi:hypothetical protein
VIALPKNGQPNPYSGVSINSMSVNDKTHVDITYRGTKTERNYNHDVKVLAEDSVENEVKTVKVTISDFKGNVIETINLK